MGQTASAISAGVETIKRRAVSKRKKTKARRAASASEPPKAPRTEAQLAAARANIERAQEARAEARRNPPPPHPADGPDRPSAFFAFGKGKTNEGDDKGAKGAAAKVADAAKRVLSAAEAESFTETLYEVLVKLWTLLDQGLTVIDFDQEECVIWRSIDDDDTRFLARRILKAGRQNALVGAQIRQLVDRWDDYRVVTILGPRVLQSVGWIPAHGIDLSAWGGPAVPPHPSHSRRSPSGTTGAGRGQSGPSPYSNGASPASGPVVDEGVYSYGGH